MNKVKKGTSVGFSKVEKEKVTFYGKELKVSVMNKVCKEHEWVHREYNYGMNTVFETRCLNCGVEKPINKQGWEDVLSEYENSEMFLMATKQFYDFLCENYFAPENKNI